MKRLNVYVLVIALITCLFGVSPASANWQLGIDNTEMDNVFEIWFLTDESHVISNYQLEFGYDTNEMTYVSYTNTPPGTLIPDFMGGMEETHPGYLHNFNAAQLFGTDPTVSSNIILGTLTFEIKPEAVKDGEPDIWFETVPPGFGITLDGEWFDFNDFQEPEFRSQHIAYGVGLDVGAPVPIPAAVWLLGSGVVGLLGVRRRLA